MSQWEYYLADPTGNITLLCVSPCGKAEHRHVAKALMQAEPTAEQAGFLSLGEQGELRLDMSGGEFCGNAAMSAAAYYGRREEIDRGTVSISVSGAREPLAVNFRKTGENRYACTVTMPPVLSVSRESFAFDGREYSFPLVRMPGIVHAICEETLSDPEAEELVRFCCEKLHAEAMGIMMLDLEREQIRPLVYVAGIASLFWENSCASGTAAVGAWLAARENERIEKTFSEPGGILQVAAAPDGTLILSGSVVLSGKRAGEA